MNNEETTNLINDTFAKRQSAYFDFVVRNFEILWRTLFMWRMEL